jgi:putative hemolysin
LDEPDSYISFLSFLFQFKGLSVDLFNSTGLYSILAILVLLVCSGLISASEVAFFSLEPAEITEFRNDRESKLAKVIVYLTDKNQRLLATILIANNLVNVGIIIISSIWFSSTFQFTSEFVTIFGLDLSSAVIEFSVQVIIVTSILLLFGEIIPKVFATQNKYTIIKIMAFPIRYLMTISGSLTNILIGTSNLLDKRFKPKGYNVTVDELSKALELTGEDDGSESEQKLLEGIIKFGNTNAKQAMTSRVDVTAIEVSAPFQEVIEVIQKTGYSRIPVYSESFDHIVGILYIKDLLSYLDKKKVNWKEFLRKPMFVPESKKIDDLLKDFQSTKMHLAIVVDEYGGSSGVISLEDILEEIVGDINDEFDNDDLQYSKIDESNYIFEGKTPLINLYKVLDIEGDNFENSKGESDTLAGFIIEIAGKIPQKNERITFENYTFTVEAADKRRIKQIKLSIDEKVSS